MLGRRGVGTYEIFLDDVRVPADRLVGEENNGWSCVLSGLQVERMTVAAGYVGNLEAIFELALNYAKERKQFGQPIGSFQAIAHMLADMQTEIAAARMLTLQAAWMLENGIDALREITMAKLFASEAHVRIVNQGNADFRRLRLQHGIRHATALPRRTSVDGRRRFVSDAAQPAR